MGYAIVAEHGPFIGSDILAIVFRQQFLLIQNIGGFIRRKRLKT